jgi:hypothetical protein
VNARESEKQMYPKLTNGDRVRFAAEAQRWTVRAVTAGGRFAILTKPFNLQRTVLYSVVDFKRGVRGRDDHYGLGYETDEQVAAALEMFQVTETREDGKAGRWDSASGADVSYRTANHMPLDFLTINNEPVRRDGSHFANDEEQGA